MSKTAAGYWRVSQDALGKESPEVYKGQIEAHAKSHGYKLVEIFGDLDVSGYFVEPTKRPDFRRMYDRRDEFDVIVTPSVNRFGRNALHSLQMFKELEDEGIELEFLDLPIDTSTPEGEWMRHQSVGQAQYESRVIGQRWRNSLDHIARKGRVTSAVHTPYGYMYDGVKTKNLVPDPESAPVVPEVFARFIRGESARSIALDLNERGVPVIRRYQKTVRDEDDKEVVETFEIRTHQKVSNRWWAATVLRIIDQPMYVGERYYKGELIQGAWEPLITRGVWEKARLLREDARGQAPSKGKHKPDYLLGGLIVCGGCGMNLHHVAQNGNRPELYNCQALRSRERDRCSAGGVAAARAHNFVWEQVAAQVSWRRLQESLQALRAEKVSRVVGSGLEERMAEVDRKMQRLVSLAVDASGPAAQEAFKVKAAALEEERRQLENELRRQQVTHAERSGQADYIENVMGRFMPELFDPKTEYDSEGNFKDPEVQRRFEQVGWSQWFLKLPVPEQKEVLRTLLKRVIVEPPPEGVKRKGHRKAMRIEWADWLVTDTRKEAA